MVPVYPSNPSAGPETILPPSETRPVSGTTGVSVYPSSGNAGCQYCIAYVVQHHDRIDTIAASHTTTVYEISALNGGIKEVQPGQTIIVPVDHCIATSR